MVWISPLGIIAKYWTTTGKESDRKLVWEAAEIGTICLPFEGISWRALDSFHWTMDTELRRPWAHVSRQLNRIEINFWFENIVLICHSNLFKASTSIPNYMHFIVAKGDGLWMERNCKSDFFHIPILSAQWRRTLSSFTVRIVLNCCRHMWVNRLGKKPHMVMYVCTGFVRLGFGSREGNRGGCMFFCEKLLQASPMSQYSQCQLIQGWSHHWPRSRPWVTVAVPLR